MAAELDLTVLLLVRKPVQVLIADETRGPSLAIEEMRVSSWNEFHEVVYVVQWSSWCGMGGPGKP